MLYKKFKREKSPAPAVLFWRWADELQLWGYGAFPNENLVEMFLWGTKYTAQSMYTVVSMRACASVRSFIVLHFSSHIVFHVVQKSSAV